MFVYGRHFLERDGIVNGNSRRSETNPENDQPFPELRLSSVREFPGSIQCIPDIWLWRGSGVGFAGPSFWVRVEKKPKVFYNPPPLEVENFFDEFSAPIGAQHRRHQNAGPPPHPLPPPR